MGGGPIRSGLAADQGRGFTTDMNVQMEKRKERVVLETENHRIVGDLHLPTEGYLSRLSDFLNRNELRFVTLTDATMIERTTTGAAQTSDHPYVSIGTDHVVFAYPDDEGGA